MAVHECGSYSERLSQFLAQDDGPPSDAPQARRVAHAKDTTGFEIERALLEHARRHPNIRILPDHMAVDLLTMSKYGGPDACFGAYILERKTGLSLCRSTGCNGKKRRTTNQGDDAEQC